MKKASKNKARVVKTNTEQSVEILKEVLGYNEILGFFGSFFSEESKKSKKSKIGEKIATIISVVTMIYWVIGAVYFSYLSGRAYYYNIGWNYIYVNENFAYQIFQYSALALVMGVLTIVFMNIWISNSFSPIKKIKKSIALWIKEGIVVLFIASINVYGGKFYKVIEDIPKCTCIEWINLGTALLFLIVAVHYFGFVALVAKWREDRKNEDKGKNKGKEVKIKKSKSNMFFVVLMCVIFVGLAWVYGWFGEVVRTEYRVIKCGISENEDVNDEYIIDANGKCLVYVVVMENQDYYVCKRLTKDVLIDVNSQILLEKDNVEVRNVSEHFDKW